MDPRSKMLRNAAVSRNDLTNIVDLKSSKLCDAGKVARIDDRRIVCRQCELNYPAGN